MTESKVTIHQFLSQAQDAEQKVQEAWERIKAQYPGMVRLSDEIYMQIQDETPPITTEEIQQALLEERYCSFECTVKLNWSPPRKDLAHIAAPMVDPGGWIYCIYRQDGKKHIGGSSRGDDKTKAVRNAVHAALRAGYNTIKFETRECPI